MSRRAKEIDESRTNRPGRDAVVARLRRMADPRAVEGMARYGIAAAGTLGVAIPALRAMAKEIGRNHRLAGELWRTGIHEARILAGFIDDPSEVTVEQMERWARDFDSWDVCDQVCSNLFDRTAHAHAAARSWSRRREEYVKRAGFTLMAALAVHDKTAPDRRFVDFLSCVEREAGDDRNYVRKAVNWALRQIGKRNAALHREAVAAAERLLAQGSASARWVARDALRELHGGKVVARLFPEGRDR